MSRNSRSRIDRSLAGPPRYAATDDERWDGDVGQVNANIRNGDQSDAVDDGSEPETGGCFAVNPLAHDITAFPDG